MNGHMRALGEYVIFTSDVKLCLGTRDSSHTTRARARATKHGASNLRYTLLSSLRDPHCYITDVNMFIRAAGLGTATSHRLSFIHPSLFPGLNSALSLSLRADLSKQHLHKLCAYARAMKLCTEVETQ